MSPAVRDALLELDASQRAVTAWCEAYPTVWSAEAKAYVGRDAAIEEARQAAWRPLYDRREAAIERLKVLAAELAEPVPSAGDVDAALDVCLGAEIAAAGVAP